MEITVSLLQTRLCLLPMPQPIVTLYPIFSSTDIYVGKVVTLRFHGDHVPKPSLDSFCRMDLT